MSEAYYRDAMSELGFPFGKDNQGGRTVFLKRGGGGGNCMMQNGVQLVAKILIYSCLLWRFLNMHP